MKDVWTVDMQKEASHMVKNGFVLFYVAKKLGVSEAFICKNLIWPKEGRGE